MSSLLTGSAFMADLAAKGLDADAAHPRADPKREAEAIDQILKGSVPKFIRKFVPIEVSFNTHAGKVFVSPDWLAVGFDDVDFIRWPLTPVGAQKVHNAFETTFPTRKIADEIFAQAGTKKVPGKKLKMHSHTEWVPLSDPGVFTFRMHQNAQYVEINKRIDADIAAAGVAKGTLVAGHKKDLILHPNVLCTRPFKPVIIYGGNFNDEWAKTGNPTQREGLFHDNGYEDYSHGIRLVSQNMEVDGKPKSIFDVMRDPDLFGLVVKTPDEAIVKGKKVVVTLGKDASGGIVAKGKGAPVDFDYPLAYP
jgi:hypothetical protein